jgi:hypothetical protein
MLLALLYPILLGFDRIEKLPGSTQCVTSSASGSEMAIFHAGIHDKLQSGVVVHLTLTLTDLRLALRMKRILRL